MDQRAVFLVLVGGVTGAIARHIVTITLPDPFPWGTVVVNIIGAFLLGIVVYEGILSGRLSRETRLLASTGFISSFTTYSAFAGDVVTLSPRLAVVYLVSTYGFGILGVLLAREVVRWLNQ